MQLASVKISNVLSFPYQPDLSKIEGIKFYDKKEKQNNVNVLIGPNGAGKSGFLSILRQIFKIGIAQNYEYHKHFIGDQVNMQKVITSKNIPLSGLRKHFAYPEQDAQALVQFVFTEHDYENFALIAKNTKLFNALIKKYSTLKFQFPELPLGQISNLSSDLTLPFTFDFFKHKIRIDDSKLSQEQKFVVSCLQNVGLVQICISIFNDIERKKSQEALHDLKHTVAMIGMERSLVTISNSVSVHERGSFVGLDLCAKKIWNIITQHESVNIDKNFMITYPKILQKSEFYQSLVEIILKYLNKTLSIELVDHQLIFHLVDAAGQHYTFGELSDGEQSLLVMIFTMYGYDLHHGLVFVDEPEIHFHPQMQRSFARMIEKISQNIGTQFVLSTYSPLFINESNIGNVYRFAKINGETKIKNPFISLSADEASLVHLLKFENMSKIFFVNKIIMVEGETDAYFFEYYLKYLHTLPAWKGKITDYEIINISGKGSYKLWNKFLTRFGLQTSFIGDRDNIVDYGLLTQNDLSSYYKQSKTYVHKAKNKKQMYDHYNRLVETIRNMYPSKYTYVLDGIKKLYGDHVFILQKGDIETYLGIREKGLQNTVKFCHYEFKQWLANKNFDAVRREFEIIFSNIFR